MFHRFVSMLILPAALLLGGFSVALAQEPTALVQIIHNAADPGAAVVDVYLGDTKAVDDFAFRTATPFLILPANTDLTVGVAPGNSMSSADVIAPFTVNLAPGRYVAVANGVLNPANFAANADPAAAPIAFDLYSIDSISDTAADDATVDFVIFHGVTDAPAVDVRTGGTALVESLSYGEATTTLSVPADSYILDVAPAGGETLVSYTADVSTLGGSSLTVVASGFLDPAANQDGPAFGLWAAIAAGGDLVELPVYTAPTTAMVQIIHNAADPGAAVVDVYLGDTKVIDDFAFRTATPFIELPVNTDLTVGVAGPNSESVADVLASFDVNLAPGRYVIIAKGVLNPANFAANADPDAAPIGFSLYAIRGISEAADDDATVDVVIFHGVTDAPAVDVRTGGTTLVESLSYGAASATLSVPAKSYILDIAPAGGATLVSYTADVSALGGASLTVVASGFLDPTANQNGPAFGLWAATAAGGALIELPPVTVSVEEELAASANVSVQPNPATSGAELLFTMPVASEATVTVVSTMGSVVLERALGMLPAGDHRFWLDATQVGSGQHYVTISAGTLRTTLPFTIVR